MSSKSRINISLDSDESAWIITTPKSMDLKKIIGSQFKVPVKTFKSSQQKVAYNSGVVDIKIKQKMYLNSKNFEK